MQELKEIIDKGILTDLMKAEQAISVFNTIAKNAKQINDSERFIMVTFGYYQQIAFNEFIMSVSRLYDKKHKRNSTRCIEAVIKYLRDNKAIFPTVVEKYQVKQHLKAFNVPDYFITFVDNEDSSIFPDKIGLYYENELLNFREDLKEIKKKRDKNLAHNEPTSIIKIDIKETEPFLEFGWRFITVLGWAFFSTIYGSSQVMHLKRDAHRHGYSVQKAIDKLVKSNGA
jgi:hypothetical protein